MSRKRLFQKNIAHGAPSLKQDAPVGSCDGSRNAQRGSMPETQSGGQGGGNSGGTGGSGTRRIKHTQRQAPAAQG